MNDGIKQLQIAVILLWAGVVLGAINLGLHAWVTYQATGQADASSPIVITAALFIFVQARLILLLHRRNPAVRNRLLMITLVRLALLLANSISLLAYAPLFVILPVLAALCQLAALAIVYLPPANQLFARPAPARP
jgi:hypothetical protein